MSPDTDDADEADDPAGATAGRCRQTHLGECSRGRGLEGLYGASQSGASMGVRRHLVASFSPVGITRSGV